MIRSIRSLKRASSRRRRWYGKYASWKSAWRQSQPAKVRPVGIPLMPGRPVECSRCGETVWEFHSQRTGKNYLCQTNNPRDFHNCGAPAGRAPVQADSPVTGKALAELRGRIVELERKVQKLEEYASLMESR